MKYIMCVMLAFVILTGCARKSRLTVDTFFLTIEPGASWVEPGGSVELNISANTASRSGIALNVSWFLQTAGKGTLSSDYGGKTVFTADPSAYGTATVAAVYNDIIKTVDIGIGVKSILSDYHLAGYFGVFPAGISPAKFVTSDSEAYFKEGSESVEAVFNLEPGEWGGFYIQEGVDPLVPETKDMSKYQNGYVRFWIKTPVDLEIKIDNTAKQLSTLGLYTDNQWHEISIAVNTLPIADITRISKYITVTAISDGTYNANAPISGSFYVDDVRWTMK